MTHYYIDHHGRYVPRKTPRGLWVLLYLLLLALLSSLFVGCAEPTQPQWRTTLDSLYARQQAGTLAVQNDSLRAVLVRRVTAMEGWR